MNLFKITGVMSVEKNDGVPKDVKVELLTQTVNWTDSEIVGHKWLEDNSFSKVFKITGIVPVDDIRVDYNDLIDVNDELIVTSNKECCDTEDVYSNLSLVEYMKTEDGSFWQSIVEFEEEKEGGGIKKTKEKHIVFSNNQVGACNRIEALLNGCQQSWKIIDTKELKTTSILVLKYEHDGLMAKNELIS